MPAKLRQPASRRTLDKAPANKPISGETPPRKTTHLMCVFGGQLSPKAMECGYYSAPGGFPNHIEFQFSTMRLDHFQQDSMPCFGVGFL